jgi:hypothetical protein
VEYDLVQGEVEAVEREPEHTYRETGVKRGELRGKKKGGLAFCSVGPFIS